MLVLHWNSPSATDFRPAIRHHLEAIKHSPAGHEVTFWNAARGSPAISLRRAAHDAVLLHNSFLWLRWFADFDAWRERFRWLEQLDCLKIAMPQDEYDHSQVLDDWLASLGVDHVLSIYGSLEWPVLYPRMSGRAAFRQVLTGYIDEGTASHLESNLLGFRDRPVDVVYRATNLPYWFGSFGQLKHLVGERARAAAESVGLATDISTRSSDAITGDDWFDFLASGRAVVGCESGSSVLDRTGEIRRSIEASLREHPMASFQEVAAQMPSGWDSYKFPAISPRHFEATITRTCQVLVEGHYSGVLAAGRHYVPVLPDMSNLAEALQQAADPVSGDRVAECAYDEIYRSGRYTYRAFAAEIDTILETRPPHRHVAATLASPSAPAIASGPAGPIARRLLSAGEGIPGISMPRLRAEADLLDSIQRAHNREPGTPDFRSVHAYAEGQALVIAIGPPTPLTTYAPADLPWPPSSIVARGIYVDGLMDGPIGRRRLAGLPLKAVGAVATARPKDVKAALRQLLDDVGGARSRPGLGNARAHVKTALAAVRAVARHPGSVKFFVASLGRASLWETADDVVKLDLLREAKSRNGVALDFDAPTQTLRVRSTNGASPAGVGFSDDAEIRRIVWDNSVVSTRVVVPLLGRRMTVYIGAAGAHEFTALAELPRSARHSLVRQLRA
ncbi:MAG TPA: hypothetical protein VGX27_13520 [Candidatus Dormibacteraeota bacterium]|nr:hypothetical protein [Candidatus Dormibacteraeota bacterium]